MDRFIHIIADPEADKRAKNEENPQTRKTGEPDCLFAFFTAVFHIYTVDFGYSEIFLSP